MGTVKTQIPSLQFSVTTPRAEFRWNILSSPGVKPRNRHKSIAYTGPFNYKKITTETRRKKGGWRGMI